MGIYFNLYWWQQASFELTLEKDGLNPAAAASIRTPEKVIYTLFLGVREEGGIFSLEITSLWHNPTPNERNKSQSLL